MMRLTAAVESSFMSKIDDGGPAFPRPGVYDATWRHVSGGQSGMSLRDWIAVQARPDFMKITSNPTELARLCYEHADAMIARRKLS